MKLSGWTIILLGLCLGLSVLSYALFQVYLPNQQATEYMQTYRAQLEAEAGKQRQADNRVQDAIQKVEDAAQAWNVYVATKTPPSSLASGGIDLYRNPYQLVVDSRKFRNSAQRAFNAQLRKGGVKIVSAPEIPQPPDSETDILPTYYNYPGLLFPVVIWDLGAITVTGTYDQIMRNVREWRNMPRYLAVADGLTISGTSPNLTGTYNVTLVGFIKGSQIYPPPGVQMASTGSTPGGSQGGSQAAPSAAAPGGGAVGGGLARPGAPQARKGP
jgi:hypothetical protein